MEYIRITKDNLEKEHICCAISNNKDVQVSSKKGWLADRFDEEHAAFIKEADLYRYGSQGTARGSRVQNREMEDGGTTLIH